MTYLPKDNTHAYIPNNNIHQHHEPYPNLLNQLKFNPHLKHEPYPKNTTGSAYRPHHIINTYHIINNWKTNSITNQIPINNEKSYFPPKK